jgi:predicted permease
MPDWKPEIRRRLAKLKLEPTREAAIVEELAQYLADCYAESLASGATEAEAYQRTLAELSGSELLARELRHAERQVAPEPIVLGTNRRTKMIADLWQDLRFGARMLRKQPSFTLIATLTLSLGIGANTAIFSIVNAALLRPLPFAQPERLVFLGEADAQGRPTAVSAADLNDFRRQSQSFELLAAHRGGGFTLTGAGASEFVSGVIVSPSFFATLRVRAALGRTFLPEEAQTGADLVVALSHQFWQRRFASSASIVGQKLTLNGEGYVVVGVLPPDFSLWEAEVWTPGFSDGAPGNRADRSVGAIGRLKPGVRLEQAAAELNTIAQRLGREHPQTNQGWSVRLLPLREAWFGDDRQTLLVLLGAAGLVLLIACVNISSLSLARASARSREMAVRTALGASRFRMLRQALTESLLLAALGGVAGLFIAHWSLRLIVAFIPANMLQFGVPGGAAAIRVDPAALLFTLAVILLAGLGFGLAPALQATQSQLSMALKEGGRSATVAAARLNLRRLLVVAEIALAMALLVGAGLLVRSFTQLKALERGFNPDNVLNLFINLPQARYRDEAQRAAFFSRAIERLQALPGVEAVGATALLSARGRAFAVEGWPQPSPGHEPKAVLRIASPDYFQTVQIPLHAGRRFTDQDAANAPGVCLINQTLARQFWPGEDPLGKQLRLLGSPAAGDNLTIVGVVGDVKESLDPRAPLSLEPQPTLYRPYLQAPNAGMLLSVRAKSDQLSLTAALRREIGALDKELPITGLRTAREDMAESMARPRFNTLLLGCFAGVAILLAASGVYGVMAYEVSQRTQEFGIRVALGAQQRDIFKLVIVGGLKLTAIGLGLGLAGAAALTRVIAIQLYGIAATDLLTFVMTSLLLVIVALLACCAPARRAVRVDPLVSLRSE